MPQALLMAGGAISAYGNISQGYAQKAAADKNAAIEDDNANFAREAGEDRAKTILRAGEMTRASIRNRASASGLVASTGSPMLIQEEAIYQSSLDAAKSRYAGSVAAYGHHQRSTLYRMAGNQAVAAGFLNASSSLIDAGGRAYVAGKK